VPQCQRYRNRPAHRTHAAVEAELTDKSVVSVYLGQLTLRHEQRDSDWQVKARTDLTHLSRR
jgi:hypothetical protein